MLILCVAAVLLGPNASALVSITLERGPCFGPCPWYKATLRPSGKVQYQGMLYVEHKGKWSAEVDASDVARLAKMVDSLGILKLKSSYTIGTVSDQPSTTLTMCYRTFNKQIDCYGDSAPSALWGLHSMIEGVLANAQHWLRAEPFDPGNR